LAQAQKAGFVRVRADGKIYGVTERIRLDKYKVHNIEVVVDRLLIAPSVRQRLFDSIETALKIGRGIVIVNELSENRDTLFSELYACVNCAISFQEIEPRIFSFNSPYGACEACNGLGTKLEFDPDLVIPDKTKPVIGAIAPWKRGGRGYILYYRSLLRELAERLDIDLDTPFKKLSKEAKKIILYGTDEMIWGRRFEGIIPHLERLFNETDSDYLKHEITKFMSVLPCPVCHGARLKRESLAVRINDKNIHQITQMSIKAAREFFTGLKLSRDKQIIAKQVLKEIIRRLDFCINVGLDYLTLERKSSTLSGGESERIRLATQVGSGLTGVVYILDEPSIGLHQRDNKKLLSTLKTLRDTGNTIIVVEHDESTIRAADHIIDLGPGAGRYGGSVVYEGDVKGLLESRDSLTAKYLNRELEIRAPKNRRDYHTKRFLKIIGASEHNLKNIDVKLPLGIFICITGVSGSGKSTLIDDILYRALAQKIYKSKERPGLHQRIEGVEFIDKVIEVDQSPIGRSPRSNPATYTGVFSYIREIFSQLPQAKLRGYKPGRFSFNVKGGRCEACQGDGIKKIEMHFLPDVYVRCEVCGGQRFNEQTLDVRYKGRSIADVLDMTVEEALDLFENIPRIRQILSTLNDVGLGYIQLGQSAMTLSGGEAQRVKLATELSKRATGNTLYLLDEPTTGLHFADIDKLLDVLQRLVNRGNTIIVIEHNLEVIKCADYIIDLGPEGGEKGGRIVAEGPPEIIAKTENSYTAKFLTSILTQ
jgi:excinuclease ABC subunit A